MSEEIRVLLAEDDVHIAKLISFKLKKEGFLVSWATDGERALTSALSEKWEVIVLDVMMPHFTGWQVLQSVRSAQIKTPVLMLTAKGEESDVRRAHELGATHFLTKPFDPSELVHILRQMLPDPELQKLMDEFISSFEERGAQLEQSLKVIYALPLDHLFTQPVANELHFIAHNLAGVAANYGFPELGQLASKVEEELLTALDSLMGSVGVSKTLRLARELRAALGLAEAAAVKNPTSFEESPASEATP
jgi:CheY-like chemotaxis protein